MPSNLPIGIFDSGVGGLTVLRHIRKQMPNEPLFYVADRRHLPYGMKSDDFIRTRSVAITEFLLSQPVKAVVVACNTATAAAVQTLRERFELPIIGMEPGVKPAIERSRNGIIGILATERTLGSGKFKMLLERHANDSELFIKPCHGWIEHIESGDLSESATRSIVEETLSPLLTKGIDTLVLGCTHYPFLIDHIKEVAGDNVLIIDTGLAVASHLQRRLEANDLLSPSTSSGQAKFWCSGPMDEMRQLLSRLWDEETELSSLPDQAKRS
jgi:glutamate racemase